MRKIIVMNNVSLDGYFADANSGIDWVVHNPAVDDKTHELMSPDTILLGRVTYQMFESYWPNVARDPNAPPDQKKLANELTSMTKIVVSKTLSGITWKNTQLVHGDLISDVKKLKQGDGPDIVIFGSGSIVHQLAPQRLIDEYLLIVSPVVLGAGKPQFPPNFKSDLKLLYSKKFPTGNVILHYAVTP